MDVEAKCQSLREEILPRWVELFFSSYPLDGTGFLRSRQDPFANPIGQTTRQCAAVLFDAVAGKDVEAAAVKTALSDLMHLRAVQDLRPSQAVGALGLLKGILRETLLPEAATGGAEAVRAYLELESRLDSLTLLALDMYTEDREQVFRLRVEEVKRSQAQVVRWAKLRGDGAGSAEG